MKTMSNKRREEKGAITLFVLLACLFFVFTLAGVYIANLNKLQTQEQQVSQIQENYARNIDRIDQIYESLSEDISVNLSQSPEPGIWVKDEVTLTGTGKVKGENVARIVGYSFSKEGDETITWEPVDNEKTIERTQKVTENGTYYFWVKDNEGNIFKSNQVDVNNIDKTAPTAGTLVDKNDTEFSKDEPIYANEDTLIKKVDGTDDTSTPTTTYTIEKDGEIYEITDGDENKIPAENIKEPETVTLTEDGTYEITVKTEDPAGNSAENTYTIIVDKTAPIAGTLVDKNDKEFSKEETLYTKEDTLIKKVDGAGPDSANEETTYTIKKDGQIYQITDANGKKVTMYDVKEPKTVTLTEEGTYTITVKTEDKTGNSAENTYTIVIDKTAPTAGTLVDKNNTEFSKDETLYTNEDTVIKKVDGTGDASEETETTYTIEKDGKIYEITDGNGDKIKAEDIKEPETVTLTEDGTYEITVKTEDKTGNSAENTYTIIVDKTAPTAGTLVDKNDEEFNVTETVYVTEDTLIKKVDGTGDTSEEIETTYTIQKDGSIYEITDGSGNKVSAENIKEPESTTLTEDGTYEITVKTVDKAGNSAENKYTIIVDQTAPTGAKLVDEQGNEFNTAEPTYADSDIYIEKIEGSDPTPGSGYKGTTYTIERNGIIYEITDINGNTVLAEDITEPSSTTLTASGRYIITVKAEDNAGNKQEKTYEIVIDKEKPELTLKHNNASGPAYTSGTWTKDSLYGEIYLETSATGKTVEKYQYSEDGTEWKEITAKILDKEIDYITTFPMSVDKPSWITGPTNVGSYYFETQADGTLKSNNNGIGSTTAESYFEIDLTDYPDANLTITIHAQISSESDKDKGTVTIKGENDASETAIIKNEANEYISGIVRATNYSTTITGGQKYTLTLKYSKDGVVDTGNDEFIINNLRLYSDELSKEINFYEYTKTNSRATFQLQDVIEKDLYIRAVYNNNEYSKHSDKISIKVDTRAPKLQSEEIEIISLTEAKANVVVKEAGSGLRGYYLSTSTTTPTSSSEWVEQTAEQFTLTGLTTNETYYLWIIDNVGNISERHEIKIGKANYSVDDKDPAETLEKAMLLAKDGSTIKLLGDYTDTSLAITSKNIILNLQNYTLTRNKEILVESGTSLEINGSGKLTTGTSNVYTIVNSGGTLTVNDSVTLENMSTKSYMAILNEASNSVVNINDNVNVIGNQVSIFNLGGKLYVNGGTIKSTSLSDNLSIGIDNYNADIYMNDGVIEGYKGVYIWGSGTLEMTGGKVIGVGSSGIEGGKVNVYGGRVEGKTYGIYNANQLTIGRQEDELSTTQPAIYGEAYGVSSDFNFYNGVIMGTTENTTYRGTVNPRENHSIYTYYDSQVEQKYCTVLESPSERIQMNITPTEYTSDSVTVTIEFPSKEGEVKQYSEDGIEWKETENNVEEIVIEENKTIYARTLNESGVITDEKQIEIDNIDKEKPTVTVSPSQTSYKVTSSSGTANISVTVTASDTGGSGLDKMQYAWAKEGETPTYVDFSNSVTINKNNLGIGQYYLYLNVTDKAGNVADVQQIRYNVKLEEPVAQIGSTTYTTVQSAVDACSKSAGETQTTIIMLKSTDEEFETYEGQNIILDLKGYTIGSSSIDTPICTNNATLQLIDSSTGKTGKLESLNGTAVLNSGTFTLGDSSTDIEMEVPTIYGYKIGINNQNIFNFYDGKIQGIAPIQGNVQDTPEEYGPVSTDLSNGITTMQLGIVTGYEARIDWVYYTTVQEAIDATKVYQNGQRDTVTIIKDIQLEEIATVEADQNLVLDLDRYELTVVSEKDRVINNYGKLEITDSSIEQTGEIKIESTSSCYGIYNNGTGEIEVSGGKVSSSSSKYSYGICNVSTGTVKVSGGTVSSSSSGSGSIYVSYGIYNAGTGTIGMNGGTVSTSSSSCQCYGIYNYGTGTVEVSGGTVSSSCSSSSYSSYGIYNNSTGIIEVSGGTVSTTGSSGSFGIYNEETGTVEVSGGTVSSSNFGIYNYGTGTIEVNGGTVEVSSDNSSYGIYNAKTGIVEISGGAVSSSSSRSGYTSYGIYNPRTGIVEISGGTVEASSISYSYGIYNGYAGSIIIGTEGDGLVSQEEPKITGEYTGTSTYNIGSGLYNYCLGNVEFYNGIIQGSGDALLGNITKVRSGYNIEENTTDEYNSIYLVEKVNTEYIVQIEETQYYTLTDAIESIQGDEEVVIQVITDFELEEVVEFNKNIILDLYGHTITNKYYKIENTGNLKITCSISSNLRVVQPTIGTIENIGTLVGILNSEEGNIVIEGGTVEVSSSNSSSSGIYNTSTGTVEVSGGTVSSGNSGSVSYGIYNESTGTVEVSGGAVSSSSSSTHSHGIYNKSTGTVEVSGGTVSSSSSGSGYNYGINNNGTGTIEVSGGTVSTSGGYASHGISNNSTGTVKMNGGTVNSNTSSYYSYGIFNNSTGTVKMNGGTVSSSSSTHSHGIYNNGKGTVKASGGTVSSSSSKYSYGIYNNGTGSIIIGTEGDGLVSQEEPKITGEYTGTSTSYVGYGIYNTTGTFYLYDGIIQGTTKAYYDTMTEYEEGTELNHNDDETILTLSTTLTPVAQIGETTYTSLQEAIDLTGTTQTTIKLLRNVAYTINDTAITIPNTKNIILDLNGYKIASAISEKAIQNEGILEIIDTSDGQTGSIVTPEEKTINNISGAKLVISGGTIENRTKYAIYNEGEVSITGGTVNSNSNNSSYGIYNTSTGTVEVSGGTVSSSGSTSYGIYNASTGTIEVSGGTVSSSGYTSYGIYNVSTGTVKASGGTVSSSSSDSAYNYSYGIYNQSTGTIIIGTKGDGTVSQEEPNIIGKSTVTSTSYAGYGIYNTTGTFYLYDGKIEGTTKAINGNIEEIEDLTELLITTDSNGNEIIQLQQVETNVAEVSGVEYDSIQEAVEACGTTARTIKVLRNSNPGATVIVEQGQNITLDLNGFTTNTYQEITNKGTLKIIDTSTGQAGKIKNSTGIAVSNKGTMEVQSGSIADSGYGIQNTGTLNITGGNIQNNSYGIYNDGSGIVNTSGGNITSNTYGIYNYGSSVTSNITGGTISSNDYGTFNAGGTTNITSAGITNNEYGVYVSGGTTNIKEGTKITSNIGVGASGGRLNIGQTGTMNSSSPVITGEEYGLSVTSTGTVYMYDGQVKGKLSSTQGYITYTETGYQVATKTDGEYMVDYLALAGTITTVAEVNGISFSNLQSAINSAIGEQAQTVKLTNGIISDMKFTVAEGQNIILDMNGKTISSDLAVTIENAGTLTIIDSSGSNVAKISSTVGIAIKNTGTLTLGQDDGTVNQELITIEGKTYGIETTGTLNFYDGTINGGSAIKGTITNRATGHVIRTTTVNGKERYYLST